MLIFSQSRLCFKQINSYFYNSIGKEKCIRLKKLYFTVNREIIQQNTKFSKEFLRNFLHLFRFGYSTEGRSGWPSQGLRKGAKVFGEKRSEFGSVGSELGSIGSELGSIGSELVSVGSESHPTWRNGRRTKLGRKPDETRFNFERTRVAIFHSDRNRKTSRISGRPMFRRKSNQIWISAGFFGKQHAGVPCARQQSKCDDRLSPNVASFPEILSRKRLKNFLFFLITWNFHLFVKYNEYSLLRALVFFNIGCKDWKFLLASK